MNWPRILRNIFSLLRCSIHSMCCPPRRQPRQLTGLFEGFGGGSVQLVPRLESIPPFLSARHVHTVTLRSLPPMGGKGDDGPRETVALFVASLRDRSAAVDASALPEGRRHKLSGRDDLD
ncbi:hypothetical protein TcCL_NonESM05674 [Trypanosoma cruzi]|nr:hypothetical protein TcCL_NonESM05674 [Trypanosoma cruzi]